MSVCCCEQFPEQPRGFLAIFAAVLRDLCGSSFQSFSAASAAFLRALCGLRFFLLALARVSLCVVLPSALASVAFAQARPLPGPDVKQIYDRLLPQIEKIPI